MQGQLRLEVGGGSWYFDVCFSFLEFISFSFPNDNEKENTINNLDKKKKNPV
jgi:hypothetical protein